MIRLSNWKQALALSAFSLVLPLRAGAATLDAESGLNPVVVGGIYDLDPAKKSIKLPSHCSAYPSMKPIGTLEVKRDIAEVKVKANTFMFAMVADSGDVTCATDPYQQGGAGFLKRPLKAGTYQLWVGEQYNKPSETPRSAMVQFLDARRGYVFAWEGKVEPRTIGKTLEGLIQIDGATTTSGGWGKLDNAKNACVGLRVQALPAVVLDVTDETTLTSSITSSEDVVQVVLGPLPEGGGEIPSDCRGVRFWHKRTWKEGRYVIYAGSKTTVDAAYSFLLLDEEKSKRDPLRMTENAGIGASIEARAAGRTFPQLQVRADLVHDDALRASLLEAAPVGLFVYPDRDLDADGAVSGLKTITPQGSTAALEDKAGAPKLPELTYPRKNEPLLPLGGGYFLATDGGLFQIEKTHHLRLAPEGDSALPAKARILWASYEQGARLAGPEDQKVVAAQKRAAAKWRKCSDNTWRLPSKKINALGKQLKDLRSRFRRTKAESAKIDRQSKQSAALDKATQKKVKTLCKSALVRANKAKARVKLLHSRAKRHEAILAKIRERF